MADTKASAFSGIGTWTALADGDLFPFVDISGTGAAKNSVATYLEVKTALSTVLLPKAGGTLTGLLTLTPSAANTGILASTGYSLTGSNATSMIDLAGTLNTTGAPSVIKLNLLDTASSDATKLIDIQLSSAPFFSLHKGIFGGTNLGGAGIAFGNPNAGGYSYSISSGRTDNRLYIGATQQVGLDVGFYNGVLTMRSGLSFGFSSADDTYSALDVIFKRSAAATLQLGETHATTPTAQTLVSHSVTTGTGANMIIGAGTGSVAGGAVILATRATTGALTTRVTVAANGEVTIVLPTSAGTPGSLWNDSGTVKVA
jgi:hypothetical protein